MNDNYIKELNNLASEYNCYLVVRKAGEIIYLGNEKNKDVINKDLPKFGMHTASKDGAFLIGTESLMVRQQDFYFSDKKEGSIFLITDTTAAFNTMKKLGINLFVIVLLILIATNGILTYLVSKSIISPLRKLKEAANEIKQGNLNFSVEPMFKDEVGELCMAFEDMRKRLKGSIELQEQYENNRKELISNISHDLKTPITAIRGYVEGIKDGIADTPEKMEKYIKIIYNKSSDMDILIDELFLYSKLDLNKIPFNFESIDICAYLEDCIEELNFDLEEKSIALSFKKDIDVPCYVSADREKLKRVVINIIGNSIKYMDKEFGKITVDLKEYSEMVVIKVEDNGKGIPKDAIPFVFDKFYRAEPSRNSKTGGSGLGLSIAKKILSDHGGCIWVDSEENLRTSISFTLIKTKQT